MGTDGCTEGATFSVAADMDGEVESTTLGDGVVRFVCVKMLASAGAGRPRSSLRATLAEGAVMMLGAAPVKRPVVLTLGHSAATAAETVVCCFWTVVPRLADDGDNEYDVTTTTATR